MQVGGRNVMKKIALSVALSSLMFATLGARPASGTGTDGQAGFAALGARPAGFPGTYVGARTAEVFAGACVMNGEAATTGREALLAWKVDRGQLNGGAVDGLGGAGALAAGANRGV